MDWKLESPEEDISLWDDPNLLKKFEEDFINTYLSLDFIQDEIKEGTPRSEIVERAWNYYEDWAVDELEYTKENAYME